MSNRDSQVLFFETTAFQDKLMQPSVPNNLTLEERKALIMLVICPPKTDEQKQAAKVFFEKTYADYIQRIQLPMAPNADIILLKYMYQSLGLDVQSLNIKR